jgi:ketosteroid isomerase-like protein
MTHLEALLKRIQLTQIDIAGDRALARKKFSGTIPLADGSAITASRQSLYRLHRQQGRWKIVGFLGQLLLD